MRGVSSMIYPQVWHRSNINDQYFVFTNTNSYICYIAMRQPKMSDTVTTHLDDTPLQPPTEAPSYGADACPNDKDMADGGGEGEIENAPSEKRSHKQDVAAADEAVSKE